MQRITWILGGALLLAGIGQASEDLQAEGLTALEACGDAVRRDSEQEALAAADRATGLFERRLEAEPDSVGARVGRARANLECRIAFAGMMRRIGLVGAIEDDLDEALALEPRHWEARYLYAILLYNLPPFLGRTDDAIEHLEILLELQESGDGPRRPEPYVMLGDLLERAGQSKRALEVWRRGAELHPDDETLRDRGGIGDEPERRSAGSDAVDSVVERLIARLEQEVQRPDVAGLSVAIARGDEQVLVQGFGWADVENEAPAAPHTVYPIGSITKQLVAAGLVRLADAGHLSLDDPVANWLDEALRHLTSGIRIHHLLTHTSGLPQDAVASVEWMRDTLAQPRTTPPSQRYAYSNVGYGLLGFVLEAAGGATWEEVLEEWVFAPLGMDDTRPCGDRVEIVKWRARGYSWQGDRLVNAATIERTPTLLYAGGLCSSIQDLLRWQRSLHRGEVLSRDGYQAMITPPAVASEEGTTYGYGVRVHSPRGRRVIRHSGGVSGFLSEAAYYPDEDLTIVVLVNSEGIDPRALGFELAEMVLGVSSTADRSGRQTVTVG